ncbi:MAG: hypothetical protein D6737_07555 [Chloroflexi bacterium]|nr:MAG: hypothetical protein CUN54_06930 [Phototrophicales bacterium]RMF80602.1 MAG: hypothetical protein D6737_07555 [Chloroflexota bacterium]
MNAPRFIIQLSLVMAMTFFSVIGLIRVQPHHDEILRDFLSPPDGCLSPCMMKIRPGVTTIRDAIDLLRAHEWVDTLEIRDDDRNAIIDGVNWSWSGAQSELIDPHTLGSLTISDGIVTGIHIRTRITFGDLWLTRPPPQRGGFTLITRSTPKRFQHAAVYPDDNLFFVNRVPCSQRVAHTPDGRLLWQQTMEYNLVSWSIDYFDEYVLSTYLPDCD